MFFFQSFAHLCWTRPTSTADDGLYLLMICRLTEAERRDWPVMSRDQDGNVDFTAWNAVNTSSSFDVLTSGAHRLDKMLIRCAY